MNKKRRIWPVVASIAAVLLASWTAYLWSQGASLKAWLALGSNNINIISHAEKVEIYRGGYHVKGTKSIGNFAITATSQTQDRPSNTQISRAVLNAYNYAPGAGGPSCVFEPGIAIRFIKGGDIVDALVCFSCSQMVLSSGQSNQFNGVLFYPVRSQFVDLAKRAFPQDAEIQKL